MTWPQLLDRHFGQLWWLVFIILAAVCWCSFCKMLGRALS